MHPRHAIVISALVGLFSLAHADTSLVARYEFSGNLNDSSGSGLDLTQNQPFYYVADRFGNANSAALIYTTGPNQPAFFGTGPDLANQSSSVAFWIRNDQITNGAWLFGLGHKLGDGGSTGEDMHVVIGDNSESISYGFFYDDLYRNVSLSPDAWTHLAFTFSLDAMEKAFYMNGQLYATQHAAFGFTGGTEFFLGGFSGVTLDDFRLYNRALSAEEVREMNGNVSGPHVPEAGMTGLYLCVALLGLASSKRLRKNNGRTFD